ATTARAHSTYYDEGSRSLHNLTQIATGDYTKVTDANPNETATAGPLRQVLEANQNITSGVGRTVADLVTGHPGAALNQAVATVTEGGSDALDLLLNDAASQASPGVNIAKTVLGWLH
ncbi:MAG: hypothetical protein ABI251_06185, partial [Mycobacteriaceae bacterium]